MLKQVATQMLTEFANGSDLLQPDSLQSTILSRLEQHASQFASLTSVKWDCVRVESARYDWISELDRQMVGSDLSTQAAMIQEITELIQDPHRVNTVVIFSHRCVTTDNVVKISVCSGTLTPEPSMVRRPYQQLRLVDTVHRLFIECAGPLVKDFRKTHQHGTDNDDALDMTLGSKLREVLGECVKVPSGADKYGSDLHFKEVSFSTLMVLGEFITVVDWELDDPDPE